MANTSETGVVGHGGIWFQLQWDAAAASLLTAEKELIPIILACECDAQGGGSTGVGIRCIVAATTRPW